MRVSVQSKLILAFTMIVLGVAVLFFFNRRGDRLVEERLQVLYERGVVGTQALGSAAAGMQRVRGRAFYHVASSDPAELAAIEQQIHDLEEDIDAYLREAKDTIPVGDPRLVQLSRARAAYRTFQKRRAEFVFPRSRRGENAEALRLMIERNGPPFSEATGILRELIEDNVDASKHHYRAAQEAAAQAAALGGWGALIVLVLSMVAVLWLGWSIVARVRQVSAAATAASQGRFVQVKVGGHDELQDLAVAFNRMNEELEKRLESERQAAEEQAAQREHLTSVLEEYGAFVGRVARGDLTASLEVSRDDELGDLGRNLSLMGEALRNMTLRIHEAVGALSSSTAQILSTTQEHSAGATQSASAVSETVASVDQVAQTAKRTAERSREVVGVAQRTLDAHAAGKQGIERTIKAMNEVRGQVDNIAQRILTLSEHAQAVGQIITTVNELAEQSNLLALNASIEAARAGEEGRGFAVVAQEIRGLAEQSKRATGQVRNILGEIQKATSSAVLVTEQGSKAVVEAVRVVESTGEHIDKLADVISTSSDAAHQILESAQQQVDGVSHISQAMHSIRQATGQTVEGTRQTERAARDLNELSAKLRDAVTQYRT